MMSPEDAVEVLNLVHHKGEADWEKTEYSVESGDGHHLTDFEAAVVAEWYIEASKTPSGPHGTMEGLRNILRATSMSNEQVEQVIDQLAERAEW